MLRTSLRLVTAAVLAFGILGCEDEGTGPANEFRATLSGAEEVPVRNVPGTGTATFTVEGTTVRYRLDVSGMTGVTAAHIHVGVRGVNGAILVGLFAATPATGAVNGTLREGSFTSADVGQVTYASLLALMRNGDTYVNVHTTAFPGGEIRGQIVPQ
ncbi:MAG TPA: CHRD domain-containing protein [Longimicrobiaceae bacterium]|nr:CHRD domain-containing protein [Longimicrobiaceae bacterium]